MFLTQIEYDVSERIKEGKNYSAIAGELNVSAASVKGVFCNLETKYGVNDRIQLFLKLLNPDEITILPQDKMQYYQYDDSGILCHKITLTKVEIEKILSFMEKHSAEPERKFILTNTLYGLGDVYTLKDTVSGEVCDIYDNL